MNSAARQTPAADTACIVIHFSDFMESPEGLGKVPSRTLPSFGSLPACWGWMEIDLAVLMRTMQLTGMAQHGERFGGIERTPFFFVIARLHQLGRSSVWLCFTRSRLPIPARNPRRSSVVQPESPPR